MVGLTVKLCKGLNKQVPRLQDEHLDYKEEEISRLACARMYFLDVFVREDVAEPVNGLHMEVAETKVEVHIGKDEERVDDRTLVDEERVVEGV